MKKIFFYCLIASSFIACKTTESISELKPGNQEKRDAVLWQQTSAEYDALCYQAYNLAKVHLEKYISGELTENGKPLAIIMDLDETVLDNSPYNGWLLKNNEAYSPVSWNKWVKLAQAEAVPGAAEFINFVSRTDIFTIYFVSNRSELLLKETIMNLKSLDISQENILLKQQSSSKIERRAEIMGQFEVVMLIGDNLADFDDAFEEDNSALGRKDAAAEFENQFGKKYIILPNPMYGDWEKALNSSDNSKNDNLKGF